MQPNLIYKFQIPNKLVFVTFDDTYLITHIEKKYFKSSNYKCVCL